MELQERVQDTKTYPPRVLLQAPNGEDPSGWIQVKCQLCQTQVLEHIFRPSRASEQADPSPCCRPVFEYEVRLYQSTSTELRREINVVVFIKSRLWEAVSSTLCTGMHIVWWVHTCVSWLTLVLLHSRGYRESAKLLVSCCIHVYVVCVYCRL